MTVPLKKGLPHDLVWFMSEEHRFELQTFQIMHHPLDRFEGLNQAFLSVFDEQVNAPGEIGLVAQLYIFVHHQLFISASNLARCHLPECLVATRKAIDATLSAYVIMMDPSTAPAYMAGKSPFVRITREIREKRLPAITDPELKARLEELLFTWGECARQASHADFDAFQHHVRQRGSLTDAGLAKLEFQPFQLPPTENEALFTWAEMIFSYASMLLLFSPFVHKVATPAVAAKWYGLARQIDSFIRTEYDEILAVRKSEIAASEKKGDLSPP